jgi:hypothetical protein
LEATIQALSTDGSTSHAIVEPKENNKTQKVRVVPKITIGEVCPFMRNAVRKTVVKVEEGSFWVQQEEQDSSGSNSKGKLLKRRELHVIWATTP